MIVGTIRILPLPDRRAEVLDILRSIQGPVLAQPGCVACDIGEEQGPEHAVLLLERFDSEEAFLSHLRSEIGARQAVDERALMNGLELGEERTFEHDPAYAIRLLVDIAIRALSPAVSDPTTAVQALDQIEDLLIRLSRCELDRRVFRDGDGAVRLAIRSPAWADLLRLALGEICACGATSVQVMRRMAALVDALIAVAPEERRPSIRDWDARLQLTIARSFATAAERSEASTEDRQGLGTPGPQLRSPYLT